jgi:hypothetical protein
MERRRSAARSLADLVPDYHPESELERAVWQDPVLLAGLVWGRPRAGHPEGTVAEHVADMLETIDRWGETGRRRADLRFIALVHDALKYRVSGWRPKAGENHHALRARRYAERYTDDERLLATIEMHDRPYHAWRRHRRRGRRYRREVTRIAGRIPDLGLFVRFLELDGSTEGKNPEPIDWFRAQLERRGAIPPQRDALGRHRG